MWRWRSGSRRPATSWMSSLRGDPSPRLLEAAFSREDASCRFHYVHYAPAANSGFSLSFEQALALAQSFFPTAPLRVLEHAVRDKLARLAGLARLPGPTECFLLTIQRHSSNRGYN